MQPVLDENIVLLQEEDQVQMPNTSRRQSAAIAGAVVGLLGIAVLVATQWHTSVAQSHRITSHEIVDLAQKESGKHTNPPRCSGPGENCSDTQCCAGDGLQCYSKDAGWAACKTSCTPGPDPSAEDGWPWECKELGPRSEGKAAKCTKMGEDCSKAKCCSEPGLQCYEKVEGWATCKPVCYKGMDLTDADSNPWSCKELGTRAPGMGAWVPKQCAAPGAACLKKGCCSTPGHQCYEQNAYYAECAETCPDGWTCKTRGSRTPLPEVKPWDVPQTIAPWVAKKCSKLGEDCRKKGCCADGGYQCFEKNSSYATCKGTCASGPDLYDTDGKDWSCNVLGPQTPGWSSEPWKERKKVSSWVDETCGEEYSTDCRKSKCCKKVGNQCYEKDKTWAACSPGCIAGTRPGDTGGNWSCKELGPRTRKPWGKPSLFCFSVCQGPPNYEAGLMTSTLGSGAGIWECDEYAVFSADKFTIGDGPDGPIETVTFVPAPVIQSKDGTAGNAELFMHVWDAVKTVGKYQGTDWTVKVDPDAVLLPDRLRWHLLPHTEENGYVVNCAKPYMPEGPMMFGALEALTRSALDAYYNGVGSCTGNMPWKEWGEDLFLGKCLEFLGVGRINDFNIYSDGVCRGVDCTDPDAAAFHPKKDPDSWHACLDESKNPKARESVQEEQWFKDYMDSYTR